MVNISPLDVLTMRKTEKLLIKYILVVTAHRIISQYNAFKSFCLLASKVQKYTQTLHIKNSPKTITTLINAVHK